MAPAARSRDGAAMGAKNLSRRVVPDLDVRLRRKDALIGEAMERYVEWRAECLAVDDAYADWLSAPSNQGELPFAAYWAALDREQSAAALYRRAVGRLE